MALLTTTLILQQQGSFFPMYFHRKRQKWCFVSLIFVTTLIFHRHNKPDTNSPLKCMLLSQTSCGRFAPAAAADWACSDNSLPRSGGVCHWAGGCDPATVEYTSTGRHTSSPAPPPTHTRYTYRDTKNQSIRSKNVRFFKNPSCIALHWPGSWWWHFVRFQNTALGSPTSPNSDILPVG